MNEDNKNNEYNEAGDINSGGTSDAGGNAKNGGLGYYDPTLFGEYQGVRAPNTAGSSGNFGGSGGTESGAGSNGTHNAGYRGGGGTYQNNINGQPNKKRKGLKIFLIIAVIFLALIVLYAIFGNHDGNYDEYRPASGEHIAVVDIIGTISLSSGSSYAASSYNQNWLLNTIDGLADNPSNRGIVLYFNTPGGSVYATDEVYLKLKEYKEETGRPIYAAFGPTAASGGYYMAMAADKIFANRNTMTGSIGVTMGTFYDVSDLLSKLGVKTYTMTSGKNKAMGSSVDPMTDEQRAIIQSILNESYDQFLDVVSKGRSMDKETLKPLADGRVYTAKQAQKAGLVDEIGTLDDTVQALADDYGIPYANVVEYNYTPKTPFWAEIFSQLSRSGLGSSEKSELSAAMELMEENEMEPMYLMQ